MVDRSTLCVFCPVRMLPECDFSLISNLSNLSPHPCPRHPAAQMMQNLLLEEGDVVSLRNATLPKGTYVKLQPHSTDFIDISNPRAVLETTLRNFSCLSGRSVVVGGGLG